MAKYIIFKLRKYGLSAGLDKYGNVYASGSSPRLLLQAHMDTVQPGKGIIVKVLGNKIVSGGNTIVGGDNKAAIAIFLNLLDRLRREEIEKVELLFTVREETGLEGIKLFDFRKLKSRLCISLDKSESNFGENLIVGGRGAEKFEMLFSGKAHHSGRPVSEENPLVSFINVFSKIKPGRYGYGGTFNVGDISGFIQQNSSPETILAKGDIRAFSMQVINQFYEEIVRIKKSLNDKVDLTIKRNIVVNPYKLDKKLAGYLIVVDLLKKLGYRPKETISTSITEASFISSLGIQTILLSCGVFEAHTTKEFVKINEMLKASIFLFSLVNSI